MLVLSGVVLFIDVEQISSSVCVNPCDGQLYGLFFDTVGRFDWSVGQLDKLNVVLVLL